MGCLLLISDGQRNSGSEMRCGSYTWRALAHQRSYGLEKLGLVKLEALLKGCPPTVELSPPRVASAEESHHRDRNAGAGECAIKV